MAETLIQWAAKIKDLAARGVVETIAAESPLFDALRLMDIGDQFQHEYNHESSLGGIAFRALNEEYAAAAKTSGIVSPFVERTAFFGGEVNTDWQLLATKPGRVAMKAKAAARKLIKVVIKGNAAATLGGSGVDPKGIDGLYVRIAAGQTVYAGANGGAISAALVDELLDAVRGDNGKKLLVMCKALRRRFALKLRAEGGTTIGLAEWAGELTPKAYNGARIIVPEEDESGTEIMAFNETRGNSAVTASVLCLRPGEADEEDVQLIGRQAEAGKLFVVDNQGVRGTQDKTVIEGRVGLALFHSKCAARLGGCLDS